MRDIRDILNKIITMIPLDYSKRGELVIRLNYISKDSCYRAPELQCISWNDANIVLRQILLEDAKSTEDWTWMDDIFELFSEGKWSKSVNKNIPVGACS